MQQSSFVYICPKSVLWQCVRSAAYDCPVPSTTAIVEYDCPVPSACPVPSMPVKRTRCLGSIPLFCHYFPFYFSGDTSIGTKKWPPALKSAPPSFHVPLLGILTRSTGDKKAYPAACTLVNALHAGVVPCIATTAMQARRSMKCCFHKRGSPEIVDWRTRCSTAISLLPA